MNVHTNRKGVARATPEFAMDMTSPVRELVTALAQNNGSVSVAAAAAAYRHHAGDLTRVKLHKGCKDDVAAKEWLIRSAATELARYVEVTEQDMVTLREGVTVGDIRYQRKKVRLNVDNHTLGDPFNPHSGELVDFRKSRGKESSADVELRESMKQFGWVDEFPAIQDERHVILVGTRRMKMAEELGIDPVIKKITIGRGDAEDVERFKLFYTSNAGRKDHTPEDRKRLSHYLVEVCNWSQKAAAEALLVSQQTISNDVSLGISSELLGVGNSENVPSDGVVERIPNARPGRPRKPRAAPVANAAELDALREQIVPLLKAGRLTQDQIAAKVGCTRSRVRTIQTWWEGQKAAIEPVLQPQAVEPDTVMCTCSHCGYVHVKQGG